LEFDRNRKREYQKLRDNLKSLFDEIRAENSFEFDQSGISYLVDLNTEKHHKIMDFLKQEQNDFQVVLRKVTEIGEEEKKILVRRYSRGSR